MNNSKFFLRGLTTFLIIFLMSGFVFSQELLTDDEPQQDTTQTNCIPKNLVTKWDSLAKKPLNQDIRLIFNFGYEYYKNQDYKEAKPYLWNVFLHDSSKYAKASVRRLADIYFIQGNVDSTLIICYRGLKLFPNMLRLHYYAGTLQNRLGKFRCAIPHFEKLVERDSTNIDYLKTLAFLYFKNDDERAVKIQEKVVELDPKNVEENDRLAQFVAHFYGEGADLEYRFNTWKKQPKNLELAFKAAKVAVRSGKYKRALEPLDTIISTKPTKAALLLRAEAYENLNEYAKAIADYKHALKLKPNDPDVMLKIADNYRSMNKFSAAKTWVYKALKAKPGYGLAYITMGSIYETAVPYCQSKMKRKETSYEDKLVYEKAYFEYKKAAKDPAFRSMAKKKQEIIKPFIPTKEDRFMHKNDKIKSPCYQWINR
ncbi:hypothetical protein DRI50_04155 [candidate division KSB1 bacterium]|nr:MAG: hypothetical protein DRI50_04155 [candidate division KSB1 bacterium]